MRINIGRELKQLVKEFTIYQHGNDTAKHWSSFIVSKAPPGGFKCTLPSHHPRYRERVNCWDSIFGEKNDIRRFWNWLYFMNRSMSEDESFRLLTDEVLADGRLSYNSIDISYLRNAPYLIRTSRNLVFALDWAISSHTFTRVSCIRVGSKNRLRHKAITVIPGGKSEPTHWDYN